MATILTFPIAGPRDSAGSSVRSVAMALKAPGEIVIFPGIRYEYHDGGAAKPKAEHRAKRDLLKIES